MDESIQTKEVNKMHDDALYQLLKQDPEAGMKALIDQYAPMVHAVVRGKLLSPPFDPSEIEHCTADTFSEFYMELDKYDPERGSIKALLCVMARHNALDLLRRHQAAPSGISLDDPDNCPDPTADYSLEGDFEDRETRLALIKAIRDLGQPDRDILLRKFYLGQSSKEIAHTLNLTVSNVDTRTHRAIRTLRNRLGGERT